MSDRAITRLRLHAQSIIQREWVMRLFLAANFYGQQKKTIITGFHLSFIPDEA